MKNIIKIFIATILVLAIHPSFCQMVTPTEATKIAENWILVIIDVKGSWGDYESAQIEPVQDLLNENRKVGYFCNVKPEGFIVLSLRKELAPVKAYSPRGYFEADDQDNPGVDIIKTSMGLILDTIESKLGPIESVPHSNMESIVEINYSQPWNDIYQYTQGKWSKIPPNQNGDNYQEGEVMLAGNNWHQYPPFNEDCPYMGCSQTSNGRAFVGCVATAGAQIMYHWDWPPYGVNPYNDSYDWPNMQDVVTGSSPQAVINAVAELGYEVALAVNMNFGCEGSGSIMYDMEGVFENYFRFSSDCMVTWRSAYTAYDWFEYLKGQFNGNRPVEYGIIGHAIVGDGWQEIGFPFVTRQYHMNWGWTATSNDTWYTLDALPEGGTDVEHVVCNIVPATAVGGWVYGAYNTQTFNYRYFDRDAIGYAATFQNGQFLQFLPEIVVTCISSTDPIRFNGSDFLNTRMFTGGDMSKGIRIYDAAIELKNFGSIKLYDE